MKGPFAVNLPSNSSLLLYGPSETGKTTLLKDILAHSDSLYATPIDQVIFCYTTWQDDYDEIKGKNSTIIFVQTQGEVEKCLSESEGHRLIIFDDHFQQAVGEMNRFLFDLLTVQCHHSGISIILVVHLIFHKNLKNLVPNFQQFAFTNVRNTLTVSMFFQQYAKPVYKQLLQHYEYCMSKDEFGIFFFSKHPRTPEAIKVRSSVVPRRGTMAFQL